MSLLKMKLAFVFLVCLVMQQNTVGSQTLPELLKDAQSQTDELHSVVTSALVKFRMEMSNVLTRTVNECLFHISKALESLQSNENDSDEQSSGLENIGNQISRCSAEADQDIQAAIKQFFVVFSPIHSESLTVLNTVLEQMVEWNNTGDPRGIATLVHNRLEVKNSQFLSNVVPLLEDELRKFKNISLLIPSNVRRCVGEASANN